MLTRNTLFATCAVFLLAVLLDGGTLAQETVKERFTRASTEVASVQVVFERDKDAPSLPASPVMSYPVGCGPDGTAYLEMLEPPDFLKRRFLSISAKEVHEFSLQTITDLTHVEVIDYFPSDTEVVYLIRAATDSELTTRTFTLPNGEKRDEAWPRGEVHAYLARFDLTGKYLGATKSDEDIRPEKVAVFPSGNLLIWGIDRLTKSPHLLIAKASGEILQYVEIPGGFDSDMVQQDNAPTRIGMRQMVAFRGGVLLIRPLATSPLLWIRDSGAVEPISLKPPPGFVIDSVLPSDVNLYVRLRPPQTKADESGHKVTGEPQLYQFDVATGRPVARFLSGNSTTAELACVAGGQFIAFERSENGNLVRMVGR